MESTTVYKKENRLQRTRIIIVFTVLLVVLFTVMILNISIGNVRISWKEILQILFSGIGESMAYNIIWKIRLPRMIMAAMLGGALALAGYLLQTFFDNPIAGPFVLGISSGAKMVVAITMVFFIKRFHIVSSYTLILAAFIGSIIATGFILLISKKLHHMATLLVGGIMIGYICSAVTEIIITFAEDSDIVNLHSWSQGSFSGMTWENVGITAIIIGITVVCVFFLSKPISAYQLGESYAQSVGIHISLFRISLILFSSILSATVTAFAGPISFVGIAVPFLIKQAMHSSKPLVVIPATFLGGAAFCMICDLIARTVFAPTEMNISTITAVFGAPIVIFMMLRKRQVR